MLQFSQQRLASEVADRLVGMAVKLHGREPHTWATPPREVGTALEKDRSGHLWPRRTVTTHKLLIGVFLPLYPKNIKNKNKFILNSFNIFMFLYYKILRTFFY